MALEPLEPLSLAKPKRRRQAAPKIDEATAASMIEQLAGSLGSGLQYVGETLDKPGRAVRGLLAGRPDQLKALIPFSDAMGLTSPHNAVSGRDLLEHHGFLSHNTPGLDTGDVAGFAAELVTDPLSWIVGPGNALAKGLKAGKAVKAAEEALPLIKVFRAGHKGQRGRLGTTFWTENPSYAKEFLETGRTPRELIESTIAPRNPLHTNNPEHARILAETYPNQAIQTASERAADVAEVAADIQKRGIGHIEEAQAKRLREMGHDFVTMPADHPYTSELADETGRIWIDLHAPKASPGSSVTRPVHPGVSPTRVIEELASGQRGLLGLKVPFAKEPFAIFGGGKTAAKLAEHAYYNPITSAVRQTFDHRLMGMWGDSWQATKLLHQGLDRAYAHKFDELANYQAHYEAIAKQLPQVQELWNDIYKAFPTVAPSNFIDAQRNATEAKGLTYMQDLVAQAMGAGTKVYHASPNPITGPFRMGAGRGFANEPAGAFFSRNADEAMRATGKPGVSVSEWSFNPKKPFIHDASSSQKLEKLFQQSKKEAADELASLGHGKVSPDDVHDFAAAAGLKTPAQRLSDKLMAMGHDAVIDRMGAGDHIALTPHVVNPWNEAFAQSELFKKAQQFDAMAGQLTGLQNSAYQSIRELGIKGKQLDDLIAHSARRRNPILGESGLGRGRTGTGFPYATRRKEPLRRLGTTTINQITTDPRVTATLDTSKAALDAAEKILVDDYGVPKLVRIKGASGKHRNYRQARALARSIANLPPEIINTGGLFPRSTALDAMDYLKHATVVRGALSSVHDMVHKFADPKAIGPTVAELFRNLGLTYKGPDSGLANWYKAFTARTGSTVPLAQLKVPYELAHAAGKMLTYHKDPTKVVGLIKMFDRMTGLFKGSLTLPFPAFHSRNFVSGLWQNAVTAFRTPSVARRAMQRVKDAMAGKDPDLLNKLKIYGIMDDSMGMAQELLNTAPGAAKAELPSLGKVFNPLVSAKRTAANFTEGMAKGGTKGAIKQVAGGLGQWGKDMNQTVEFFNRASHFAARLEDGWDPALAARSTKLAHFDYSELSWFEKNVMKRLIPFYTFSRKNLPLQIRELFNRPGGPTAQTIRGMVDARNATSRGNNVEDRFTPKWLGEGLAFRLAGGGERDAKFFSESGLLPVSEAFNRYPTMNGAPDAKMITENILGSANPLLAGPLQLAVGRQFWSHRDMSELQQSPFNSPLLNFWLYQSPLSRGVATGRMIADERKTAKEKLFNALLGGARFTDVDLKKAINFQLRDVLERELKHSAGVGEYNKLYARDLEKISPESQAQLSLLVQLLQEYKQMQAEDVASGRAKPRKKK